LIEEQKVTKRIPVSQKTFHLSPISFNQERLILLTFGILLQGVKGNLSEDPYSRPAFWHDKDEAWHEAFSGVKRRVLSHSTTGVMVLYRIEPGKIFPLHSHPHAQFGVFLEGGGDFIVEGNTWKMKKGDSYFIPPGVMHELRTSRDEVSVVVDFFTPERKDYASECPPPDGP
jgi:quercetin dioxygenase-like cupin family protein